MMRGITYSRSLAVASAFALAAAALATRFRRSVALDRSDSIRAEATRKEDLERALASKAYFSDIKLDLARQEAATRQARLDSGNSWNSLVNEIGPEWHAALGRSDRHDGYLTAVAVLQLLSPETSDWPRIVAAVSAVERRPGMGVIEIEVNSSGDREHRSMDNARLVISVYSRPPSSDAPSP